MKLRIEPLIVVIIMSTLLLFLANSCGFKQLIAQDITQTTAYLIAKKYPQFATELLEYTKDFLNQEGKELVNYQYWREYVAGSLVKDEFLRLKFKRILSLVDVELNLKAPIEQEEIIGDLWREFILGLKAGIDASK